MTGTITQPKVQELSKRSDLLLLLRGDLVWIRIGDYEGIARYEGRDTLSIGKNSLDFKAMEDNGQRFRYYFLDFYKADIKDNTIVRRTE